MNKKIKINVEQLFSNIIMIVECLNIIFLNFFSNKGFNLYNTIPSFVIMILFISIKYFKFKEKLQFNLIDFIIMLFPFTYLIPIIFGTFATLKGAICGVIYGFALYSIYIVIRNVKNKNAMIKFIFNTLIITNILYIIIGIDIKSSNVVSEFLKKVFNLTIEIQDKSRFTTAIAYVNANAVFMLVSYFISVYEYFASNKKILKNTYLGISNLFLGYFILTYSRLVNCLGLLIIIIMLIVIIKKNVFNKKEILYLLINNIFFSTAIVLGYTKLISLNKYAIWIFMAVYIAIYFICAVIYEKIVRNIKPKKIEKANKVIKNNKLISKKSTYIILGTIIVCTIIVIIADLIIGKSAIISKKGQSEEISYLDATQGEDCKFEFYFKVIEETNAVPLKANNNDYNSASSTESSKPLFEITIIEQNEYNGTNSKNEITIKSGDTEKSIVIPVKNDTIRINVKATKLENDSSKLEIYKTMINEKKVNLCYRFIPKKIVGSIQSIFHKSFSMNERFVGMADGIRLGCKHFLTGTGDYSWRYIKLQGQTYTYGCTDVHCYPIVIFIENGIFGFTVILAICALTIYYIIKYLEMTRQNKLKKEDILQFGIILLSIIPIVLHSFLDFDLSINIIKVLLVILIALLMNELEKVHITDKKIFKSNSIMIVVSIVCVVFICAIYPKYSTDNTYSNVNSKINKIADKSSGEVFKQLDNFIYTEPYNNRVNVLNRYNRELKEALQSESNGMRLNYDIKKNIDKFYEYTNKKLYKWNFSIEENRLKNAKEFSKELEEIYKKTGDIYYNIMSVKFESIFNNNYDEIINDAQNYKCYLSNKDKSQKNIEDIKKLNET